MSSISVLMSMIQKNKAAIDEVSVSVMGELEAMEAIGERQAISIKAGKAMVKTVSKRAAGPIYLYNQPSFMRPKVLPLKVTDPALSEFVYSVAIGANGSNNAKFYVLKTNRSTVTGAGVSEIHVGGNPRDITIAKVNDLTYVVFNIWTSGDVYYMILTRDSTDSVIFAQSSLMILNVGNGYAIDATGVPETGQIIIGVRAYNPTQKYRLYSAKVEGGALTITGSSPEYEPLNGISDFWTTIKIDVLGNKVVMMYLQPSGNAALVVGTFDATGDFTMGAFQYPSGISKHGCLSAFLLTEDVLCVPQGINFYFYNLNGVEIDVSSPGTLNLLQEAEVSSANYPLFYRTENDPKTAYFQCRTSSSSGDINLLICEYDSVAKRLGVAKGPTIATSVYITGSMVIDENEFFVMSIVNTNSELKYWPAVAKVPILSEAGVSLHSAAEGEMVKIAFSGEVKDMNGVIPGMDYDGIAKGVTPTSIYVVPFWEREA